jgi:hypothetical protein
MTWLTPLTGMLLAAGVVPPLILLYFLKLRRRSVPVACTLLWKKSVEDLRANAPFQRLRLTLLLLLQLLALLLVALAIAQPQVDIGRRSGGRTIILIDHSASMNAMDGGGAGGQPRTRLDAAKELARARVEQLFAGGLFAGPSRQVMVIAFADRAEVRTPFTLSRAQAIQAIEGIEATDGPTRLGDALDLARAFATVPDAEGLEGVSEQPASLELFSDGRIADLGTRVLREGESMVFTVVGTPDAPNAGIATLSAERPYDKPGQVQVFVSLYNASSEVTAADVQLSVNGTVQAITPRPVEIPAAVIDPGTGQYAPGGAQVAFLPFDQPRGAVVEVALLREDALALDNVANLVIPPLRRLSVALVDPEGFFFPSVLEGLRESMIGEVRTLTAEEFAALAAADQLSQFDVVIIDDFVPDALPAGRFIAFGGTMPLPGLNDFGTKGSVLVRAMRDQHPLFRFVSFDDLLIGKMRALAPDTDVEVLAEAAEGPIVLFTERGSTALLQVTFNPLDSNGPFGDGLVNFVCNAIEWMGTGRDALSREGFRPGEALTTRLPADAQEIRLQLPDRTELPVVTADPERFAWGPLRLTGLYELSWDAPTGTAGRTSSREARAFAVNLFDPQEGHIAPVEDLKLGVETVAGRRPGQGLQTPLWPWALGACLLVLLAEWWVYVRRTGG